MAVLVRNLTEQQLRLPSPISGALGPREDKVFQFVAYDDVINTEVIFRSIQAETIAVIQLDDLTPFNDVEQVILLDKNTAAMAKGQASYVSADDTFTPTDASTGTGTFQTATFAGVYAGVDGQIITNGIVEVLFDGGLGVVAGDPALLSWVNAGQFRNGPPGAGSGHFNALVGEVVNASLYGATGRAVITIHRAPPVKISGP